jgi:hypothetical protein
MPTWCKTGTSTLPIRKVFGNNGMPISRPPPTHTEKRHGMDGAAAVWLRLDEGRFLMPKALLAVL